MVGRTLATVAALAGLSIAAPAPVPLDVTVLQFALTLEHLENEFYKGAVAKFSPEDFERAGYSPDYYNNLKHIGFDEQQHVVLLTSAIKAAGFQPVAACTYTFPYTDVPSFITLSSVLEGVGTSAYLGGAPLITKKQYLTVAGSILATEALHTSYQRAAIGEVPFANPLATPLDPTSVFTLASAFIDKCPKSNMALPFTPFPALQVDGNTCTCEEPECHSPSEYIKKRWGSHGEGWPKTWHHGEGECSPPTAGESQTFEAGKAVPKGSFITFVNGLTVTSVPATIKDKTATAKIPAGIAGQTYSFITKSNVEGTFDDSQVLFGPAIVEVKPQPAVIVNSIN